MRSPRWPELWGGVECTRNRVNDAYYDQCSRNGHRTRLDDLDRFASLGLKALRYPVLWENTAPKGLDTANWEWPDERLTRLRSLGVRPIVGLVHHGSGPPHTSLVDSSFATGLADFARAVAQRYPWVRDFTPVNEPLTTARFSGLYGHWYPHGKDDSTFVRTLLIQCRAVVQSMAAIREINPEARLVQTEDVGRTFSTPRLAYQAEFENQRRWLSFDLLCGHVDRRHPLWIWLIESGARTEDLEFFLRNPTPPDVVGLNYYLTSDRVLDEKTWNYPSWSHGGNGRDLYADVEAVRAWPDGILGHRAALEAAWQRYRLPVALTEVHLGCTREEQLRWLHEAWEGAKSVLAAGGQVRAVTVWSLLGAFDWNSLVTAERGVYEPGVFDVRAPRPRPTALATMARQLAASGRCAHPVLASGGFWRRPMRLWPPLGPPTFKSCQTPHPVAEMARPLLITGATGTLGRAFARICKLRGLRYQLLSRRDMDITSGASVASAIERYQPWAVINAAGNVRVDEAEADPSACFRENTLGPVLLAAVCRSEGVQLVTFSSDLVFDGDARRPYLETDKTRPLNVYGESKAEAEMQVLKKLPNALVIRTSAFFGPWDIHNFVFKALTSISEGRRFQAAHNVVVSPTYVPDLVHATLDLLIDGEGGIWHLTHGAEVTWFSLARRAAELAGLDGEQVEGGFIEAMGLLAQRPRYSALGSSRGQLLPTLEDALRRYIVERELPSLSPQPPAARPHEDRANRVHPE